MIESLPSFLFPTRRRGLRWLKEQLRELGVTAPLSPSCLGDFVACAAKAALLAQGADETYAASLRRQLEAEARFIHLWTNSDDKLSQPEWSEWIAIAQRHLLPRSQQNRPSSRQTGAPSPPAREAVPSASAGRAGA